jgi:hypothetical protein
MTVSCPSRDADRGSSQQSDALCPGSSAGPFRSLAPRSEPIPSQVVAARYLLSRTVGPWHARGRRFEPGWVRRPGPNRLLCRRKELEADARTLTASGLARLTGCAGEAGALSHQADGCGNQIYTRTTVLGDGMPSETGR